MKVGSSIKAGKGYVVVSRRNKSGTKRRKYLVQVNRKKTGRKNANVKARQG